MASVEIVALFLLLISHLSLRTFRNGENITDLSGSELMAIPHVDSSLFIIILTALMECNFHTISVHIISVQINDF